MPDPRFYEDLGPVTTGELAAVAGARLADESKSGREQKWEQEWERAQKPES